MRSTLLEAVALLLVITLSGPLVAQTPPAPAPVAPDPVATAYVNDLKAATDAKQLVIQGFFFGMTKAEVQYLISTRKDDFVGQLGPNFRTTWDELTDIEAQLGGNRHDMHGWVKHTIPEAERGYVGFIFDDQDHLVQVSWNSVTVDKLFNVADMGNTDFVQAFINSYQVPTFDATVGEDGTQFYKSTSPDGYEVTIFSDKSLTFRQIPKATDRKFN
jgi:hypothetical protein